MARSGGAALARPVVAARRAALRRVYGDLTVGARVDARERGFRSTTALALLEDQVDSGCTGWPTPPGRLGRGPGRGCAAALVRAHAGRSQGDHDGLDTLGQRTLRYETYVMPAPEENQVQLYEQLLRRNERLVGAHFSIGVEDAVFLRGELPLAALTEDELDRVVGSLYAYVEQVFPAAIRLGFASRF